LGALPLVVLTSGKTTKKAAMKQGIMSKIEIRLKNELVALSSNSQHIIAKKSGHFIMYDEPKLVIKSIEEMLKKIQ